MPASAARLIYLLHRRGTGQPGAVATDEFHYYGDADRGWAC